MQRVGIKYCGGCNPRIDRSRIAIEITRRLAAEYISDTGASDNPLDVGIMLCGCPVACINITPVRNLARRWVLVTGTMVDQIEVSEDKIADAVLAKL